MKADLYVDKCCRIAQKVIEEAALLQFSHSIVVLKAGLLDLSV